MLRPGKCSDPACGHDAAAHEHYRSGIDCGLCPCPGYIASSTIGWLARLRFALRVL